jgi:hypothetical protein
VGKRELNKDTHKKMMKQIRRGTFARLQAGSRTLSLTLGEKVSRR